MLAGASKIVLDVTCGSGAFMKNIEDAKELAKKMNIIGKLAGKETISIITNMDEPLGYSIGNNLEVIETIHALNGKIEDDVKQVVLELGSYILKLAGKGENIEDNKTKILNAIDSKIALDKFKELVKNQGGDISYIENPSKFEKAKYEIGILAKENGYIQQINAEEIGKIAGDLGAGRVKKEDNIDFTAGIILNKKVGDFVEKGDKLAYLYTNKENYEDAKIKLESIIKISEQTKEKPKTVLGIIE